MRILYHHRTQGRGAEGVHIREIVKALRDLGNEVYIVSPPGIDPFVEGGKKEVVGGRLRLRRRKIWERLSRYTPQIGFEMLEICYNFVAYRSIKKILEKERIDFIYERYAFFGFAATYLAKRYKIPIILEVNEVSGIKRMREQVLVRLAKIIEKKIFDRVDVIVTVSSFLKKHIEEMWIDSNRIYLIPNGVNIERFNLGVDGKEIRKRFNLNGRVVLGFAGWFSRWDNLRFLVQGFADLVQEKRNIHLLLIGDGLGRRELEKSVKEEGISNNVVFAGRVNREDIPNFIASMDICVIPHSNPFGSPIVLFEYMAMAKPVVAPRLAPLEDVIVHNKNGILFETNNSNGFKRAIIELAESEEKRRGIGANARKRVVESFQWKHNAEKILDIYKRLKVR